MIYTLNTITEKNVTRYLLCDNKENFYSINQLLYKILFEYKNTQNIKNICESINKNRTANFITEHYIEQSILETKEIIFKAESTIPNKNNYIKNRATIIKKDHFQKIYAFLSFLFNKKVFLLLSILSLFFSFDFFLKKGYTNLSSLYDHLIAASSVINFIIFFLLSLCIILLHEIGHATAAIKNKIQPKEIGIGLYFIFPVLYTNVTNVWSLPASKRIIVNIGGIYFQLIINIILLFLYNISYLKDVTLLLLVFNSLSILISFIPFFRYDGYWLFSDYFGISNLREKSTAFMINAVIHPNKIKNYIQKNSTKTATIIYSILNVAFWAWVYFAIVNFLLKNIPQSISLLFIKEEFSIKSVGTLLNCFLILFWLFTSIKTIYLNLLKNNNHAKQQFNLSK